MPGKKTALLSPKTYEGMSQYRPPLCLELKGNTYELIMDDGNELEISFPERQKITVSQNGTGIGEFKCDVLKADDDAYFINYTEIDKRPRKGVSIILDTEQDLVTIVNAYDGWNPRYPHMVKTEIIFGAVRRPDGSLNPMRHGYTEDMLGKAIQWNYGTMEVIHVYQSSHYYRLSIPKELLTVPLEEDPVWLNGFAGPGEIYEEPADYIKVKDGIYIFSMTEQTRARKSEGGANLLFLMNLNRMYDVGRSFGVGGDGVSSHPENYTYGAYGKYVDAEEYTKGKSTAHIE